MPETRIETEYFDEEGNITDTVYREVSDEELAEEARGAKILNIRCSRLCYADCG